MQKRIVKLKKQENTTLREHFNDFINDCQVRGLANETIINYKRQINLFINFAGNKEINTSLLNEYVVYMRNIGNNDITMQSKLKFIKVFLNFSGYSDDIKYPIITAVRQNKEPYTDDEIKLLLKKPVINSYTEWRNHTIVCTFLATGMRLNTLINLKINDLDFNNYTIFLGITKTRKQYKIPMSSDLRATLRNYLSLFDHEDDDYLFMTLYGEKMCRDTIKGAVHDYNIRRGVQTTSIHKFRHTFAINYLRNGGNIMMLKEILGHSSIRTTQQYLHVTVDDLKHDFDNFCPLDVQKRKGIKIKKGK